MPVLALVKDLIFASRISEVSRGLGVNLLKARTLAEFHSVCQKERPNLIIVDLGNSEFSPEEVMQAISQDLPFPRSVGFFAHIDDETETAAKRAGFSEVVPRSKFVRILPELLIKASAAG